MKKLAAFWKVEVKAKKKEPDLLSTLTSAY
jgi:hypothetical protein